MGVTLFFPEKNLTTFFSHRSLKVTFLAVVSSPLPSSHVVYVIHPVFFLNSTTKKINFRSGVTTWRVSRGAARPFPVLPSDATVGNSYSIAIMKAERQ